MSAMQLILYVLSILSDDIPNLTTWLAEGFRLISRRSAEHTDCEGSTASKQLFLQDIAAAFADCTYSTVLCIYILLSTTVLHVRVM